LPKTVSIAMVVFLTISSLALALHIQLAGAGGTIYINADRSITPAIAPISTVDNITYMFTGNINESIVVQRSSIVVNGAGHTVHGSGSGNGVDLESVNNVTLENTNITNFSSAIMLNTSSNDTLSDNGLTWNGYGIYLNASSNNTLSHNYASGSPIGIYLNASSNNTLSGNTAVENYEGIVLDYSSDNALSGNDVAKNPAYGILLNSSTYNTLAGNTAFDNAGLGDVGIDLWSSSNNTLSGNNATVNYYGIVLDSSSGNVLSQNVIARSFWCNFGVGGSSLNDYINWVDASNLADGKPIIYIVNQNGLVIDPSTYPSIGYLAIVNCTSISVENLSLANINQQGLLLAYSTNCTLTQNKLVNTANGINLYSSSNNTLSNNNVTAANQYTRYGISLDFSSNNTVSSNNVTGNLSGIDLESSSDNTVSDNRVVENHVAIGVTGANNVVSGNFVSGSISCGIWLFDSSNGTVSGNTATQNNFMGIGMTSCFDDTVSNNNASGNYGKGIYVYDECFNEMVSNNDASQNTNDGIAVDDCSNVTVSGNNMTGNGESGITLYSTVYTCYDNAVFGNSVIRNRYGISLNTSFNNTIYHNNFINNAQQAVISGSEPNTWDNGYPSGGNYWNDYNGTDVYSGPYQNVTGSDGIGDTPYVIDANNTDHYPLVVHDLVVTDVVGSKTVVGQGYSLNITVTAIDLGNVPETFNTTVYANTTPIASQNATLSKENSVQVTFTWNTTAFAYGNYTISAYAWPVQNETNTGNNNMTCGTVYVGIPGDINGDGTVDIADAIILSGAFLTQRGESGWNPNSDINGDGTVDIADAIIFSGNFFATIP
jgi:parallel beta-helix repeat protein